MFLPGIYEIETFEKMLKDPKLDPEYKDRLQSCEIFIMHSLLSTEVQKRVFTDRGKPKIILATNIAESSITIPDIKIVIDFCLTKFLKTNSETKVTSLELHWASRKNCEQR